MQRLGVGARVCDEDPEKILYLCPNESLDNLWARISPGTAYFGLFVAMDARAVTDETILQAAKKLLSQGLATLCAWGPECGRVHDLFDRAIRETNSEQSDDDAIMTSWHDGESLEKALWYFIHTAFVTAKFEELCKDWIIAPISNPEWEQLIRSKFAEINRIIEDE